MHSYRVNSRDTWDVVFNYGGSNERERHVKTFPDEAAAVAFVNFLNGGSDDGWSTAKGLLRRAEDSK